MNDRIHAWLDGDLPLDALTAEERDRARGIQAALDLTASIQDVRSPGLADGVMARLPARAPARRPSPAAWIRGVRDAITAGPLALRPAGALAAACLAAGFGLGLWAAPREPAVPSGIATAAEAPAVFVRFDLEVSGATSVQLAGSFSSWQPAYALTPGAEDHWSVTIPLTPGVHDYVFVVDGERHVLDPAAPRVSDGFGSFNNRIALLASAT
jgi:hypothetical protein